MRHLGPRVASLPINRKTNCRTLCSSVQFVQNRVKLFEDFKQPHRGVSRGDVCFWHRLPIAVKEPHPLLQIRSDPRGNEAQARSLRVFAGFEAGQRLGFSGCSCAYRFRENGCRCEILPVRDGRRNEIIKAQFYTPLFGCRLIFAPALTAADVYDGDRYDRRDQAQDQQDRQRNEGVSDKLPTEEPTEK